MARRAARSSWKASTASRTKTSSSARTWSSPSRTAATSSACRSRPIGRSAAAARAAPACRRATRTLSRGSSWPRRIRRSSSSRRSARSTKRRFGVSPSRRPQARGKALVNMLPLDQGERITTVMPLPEDEAEWGDYDVMFATTRGTVRRNKPLRFHADQPRRQDRDEARSRRRDRRRADLPRERRHVADDAEGPVHPLRRHRRARVQGPRFDGRGAALRWARRTASSRCRSCATSRPIPASGWPI